MIKQLGQSPVSYAASLVIRATVSRHEFPPFFLLSFNLSFISVFNERLEVDRGYLIDLLRELTRDEYV